MLRTLPLPLPLPPPTWYQGATGAELTRFCGLIEELTRTFYFGRVPTRLKDCLKLQSIHLSGNLITEFPTMLLELPFLVDLKLDYNRLTTIPFDIGCGPALKRLDVAHNNLIFVNPGAR
jgi:Leucine-rich repeat (LRR) protein